MDLTGSGENKEKAFLTWCHNTTTDTALKKTDADATSTITVLAREIGQLLGKGYVFKEIRNSFQAFHPQKEDNATEYFNRKSDETATI